MSVYPIPDLKTRIDTYINTNGVKAITGPVLNSILKDVIDSLNEYTDDELAAAVADLVTNTALTTALGNYLLKSGGIMTGNLNMNGNNIVSTILTLQATLDAIYFKNGANANLSMNISSITGTKVISWRNLAGTPAFLDDIKNNYFFAASDETTDLVAGASAVFTDYIPYAITVSSIMISVNTAPTGANIIVDIKKNGTTIFTTPISIDATENTSLTASTPYVLDGSVSFAQGDKIEAIIIQVGSTIAGAGLKIKILD